FCSSSANSGSITSSTSVSGVSYQLYNSSNAVVQAAKTGTGSGLTWSNLSGGTGYYVIATGAAPTNCAATSSPVNVVQNQTPVLLITPPAAPCTPGTADLTAAAVTAGSTLPTGTTLSYWRTYDSNTGLSGELTLATTPPKNAVSAGTYWIKATSPAGCTDIESVTIAVNNCGGAIYATATTCSNFLSGVNTLDKICYTVSKKGNKSYVSNATPGVFFYYAKIVAPSTSFTVNILEFITAPSGFKLFTINQNQVFAFDANCNKIATGSESPKGSGQGVITVNNVKIGDLIVISVKYDVKSILNSTFSGTGPNYQAYFISKIGSTVLGDTAGNIPVNNCSVSTAAATTVASAPTETTTTSKTTDTSFIAYPVPFKDQLTIKYKFDYKSDVKIEVFNVLGTLVFTKHDADGYLNKEVLLDLTNTDQQGLYIVKVSTNRGSSTKKVISSR
ncbi:T9SS type A sorting domain-containing protein, partial [Flavobacterium sp. JAS]|uniref:T9SS type A sorting domain-containing protein n=1 Tax=Flavobacterium sp. JAS TaxID=2897329 RepID=UPI001E2B099A